MDEMISVDEAAKLIGYSKLAILRFIRTGKLKGYQATPTSDYRVKVKDLKKLMRPAAGPIEKGYALKDRPTE